LKADEVSNHNETAKRLMFPRNGTVPSDRRATLATPVSPETLLDPLPASV